MRYLATHEHAPPGHLRLPIELYYVNPSTPRYEMPFHWHMEHELILVLQGVLRLSVEGEAFELAPGDCMLIADGAIHGGTPEGCIYECLVFDWSAFWRAPPPAASGWPCSPRGKPGWRGNSPRAPRRRPLSASCSRP